MEVLFLAAGIAVFVLIVIAVVLHNSPPVVYKEQPRVKLGEQVNYNSACYRCETTVPDPACPLCGTNFSSARPIIKISPPQH